MSLLLQMDISHLANLTVLHADKASISFKSLITASPKIEDLACRQLDVTNCKNS